MAFTRPRGSRLLIGCILGIGLALLFVRPSAHVWGQEPGGRPANLDVILLIDNSWSMSKGDPATGTPPSDPEELRIRAAKFLVDYLRANAETLGANYRVGVVIFGGVVSDVTPLRLLQDDTVRDSIRAEEIRLTDFRGPLQFALREFEAKGFGTGNKMAVILLTDGRPDLTGPPMTEQELRDYFEDLAPLVGELREGGVSLFVLGIGDAQEDRDNWTRLIPQECYIPITSATDLADVYHDIVASLIGVAVSKEEILPAEQAASIEVEPYLERIVFSFMKSDPAIRVVLIPPTGAALTPTIGGTTDVHHAIYRITNPDAGEWKALWEGEGEVRYWVDKQYPLIPVEPVESASLVDWPITITASLVRNHVTVVDPRLHLEAEITLPGGDVVTQVLSPVDGGRYSGSYEDVKMEGTYTVTARAFLDGQPLSVRLLPATVRVFPLPAVAMPTPQPTLAPTQTPMPTPTPIGVTDSIELLQLGDPIVSPKRPRVGESVHIHVPVGAAEDISPMYVIARVRDDTRVVTTTMLVPETNGFGGELGVLLRPYSFAPSHRYTVTVFVIARTELPGGLVLLPQRETAVRVRWSLWWDVACAILIVAVVGAIGGMTWRYRQELSAAWCGLQLRRLKATQAVVEALQGNRLIPAILPAERLKRWRERLKRWHRRLSQRYAGLDVEPLYAEVHQEVKRIEHQDLRAPEQLRQVRKALEQQKQPLTLRVVKLPISKSG
jgi:hypothetical protein